jgi:DNA-directed RNA polymerase specialized sigma24 family protein
LRLRVIDGYGYDEIAGALGVSEQTVRARVSRGLRALRDLLDQEHLRGAVSVD